MIVSKYKVIVLIAFWRPRPGTNFLIRSDGWGSSKRGQPGGREKAPQSEVSQDWAGQEGLRYVDFRKEDSTSTSTENNSAAKPPLDLRTSEIVPRSDGPFGLVPC